VVLLLGVGCSPPGASAVSASPVPAGAWGWPVAGAPVVVRDYAAPATRYGAGHRGLDLAAAAGSEVLAPAAGVVAFAGPVAGRPVVAIDHAGGYRSSLEPVESSLPVGTAVQKGQPVGSVAAGGHCGGCVHLGVRLHGEYLDPRSLIVGIPRAVLLPAG
jgi:murein DD-endopeptidase MepM/ murein hydrolase activator NlpD